MFLYRVPCILTQLLILLVLIPTLQGVSDHMAWEPAGDAGTSETALEISGCIYTDDFRIF